LTEIPQFISRNPFKGDNDLRQHLGMDRGHQGGQTGGLLLFALRPRCVAHEIMLLGCVSLRVGQKIEWDGPNMRATNCRQPHSSSNATTAAAGNCRKTVKKQNAEAHRLCVFLCPETTWNPAATAYSRLWI